MHLIYSWPNYNIGMTNKEFLGGWYLEFIKTSQAVFMGTRPDADEDYLADIDNISTIHSLSRMEIMRVVVKPDMQRVKKFIKTGEADEDTLLAIKRHINDLVILASLIEAKQEVVTDEVGLYIVGVLFKVIKYIESTQRLTVFITDTNTLELLRQMLYSDKTLPVSTYNSGKHLYSIEGLLPMEVGQFMEDCVVQGKKYSGAMVTFRYDLIRDVK